MVCKVLEASRGIHTTSYIVDMPTTILEAMGIWRKPRGHMGSSTTILCQIRKAILVFAMVADS
jgi:hypothetical protein